MVAHSHRWANARGRPPSFAVVLNQRACRDDTDSPIDDNTIETILAAAAHAPSSENKQPWEFVVVRDSEIVGSTHCDRYGKAW